MTTKSILVFCVLGFFIQTTLSQCTNRATTDVSGIGPYGQTALTTPGLTGLTLANGPLASGYKGLSSVPGRPFDGFYTPTMDFTATSGGSLAVTSTSAIAPTGITIVSENVFEGPITIAGELPFVGTTGMEGAMASAGTGAINHSCGFNAMVSEGTIAPGATVTPAAPIGAGLGPSALSSQGFGPGYGPANRLRLGGCGRSVLT